MVQVRRGELEDAAGVVALLGANAEEAGQRWGEVRVSTHVEHSCLSVTVLEDDTDRIVGFASFFDYPRVMEHKVPAASWEKWTSERVVFLNDTPAA